MLKPNQLRSEATSSFSLPALTSVGCKEIFVPYLASGVWNILQTSVSFHFHDTGNKRNTRLPSSQCVVGLVFGVVGFGFLVGCLFLSRLSHPNISSICHLLILKQRITQGIILFSHLEGSPCYCTAWKPSGKVIYANYMYFSAWITFPPLLVMSHLAWSGLLLWMERAHQGSASQELFPLAESHLGLEPHGLRFCCQPLCAWVTVVTRVFTGIAGENWSQALGNLWCWGWWLMASHQSCLAQFQNTGHMVFFL